MNESTTMERVNGDDVATATMLPAAIQPGFDLNAGKLAFWSSLPTTNRQDKALILAALQDSDERLDALIGKGWMTKNLLAHPVAVTDEETGEILMAVRLVLIAPDGQTAACCSAGAVRSATAIIQLYGQPPWDPPLYLTVKQVTTRKGRRTFVLGVADPDAPEPVKVRTKPGR